MTGINWLLFILGILLGALGQRWLGMVWRSTEGKQTPAAPQSKEVSPQPQAVSEGTAVPPTRQAQEPGESEGDWLWLAYVRALERSQFQGGFLARTAHELRSPLSSLMGLQQLILTDLCDSPEEERQCVAQSYEAAQNLHSLMDKVISISKLEQGSRRLDIQPIALDILLEEIQTLVELQMADRNVRLHLDLPDQSIYAYGDYSSLRQFWVMLLETSVAQNSQELALSLTVEDGGVRLVLWLDQPWTDWQESIHHLGSVTSEDAKAVEQDSTSNAQAMAQLKQRLRQTPDEAFVPHRLSPGMVLLISQLIVELNQGSLRLVTPEEGRPGEDRLEQDKFTDGASEGGGVDDGTAEQVADAWGGANWRNRLTPYFECRLQA